MIRLLLKRLRLDKCSCNANVIGWAILLPLSVCSHTLPALEDEDDDEFLDPEIELGLTLESWERPTDRMNAFTLDLTLSSEFVLSPSLFGFGELTVTAEKVQEPQLHDINREYVQIDELWLGWNWTNRDSAFVWLGRREIVDETGWWWDEESTGIGFAASSTDDDKDNPPLQLAIIDASNTWSTETMITEPDEESIAHFLGAYRIPVSDHSIFTVFLTHQTDLSDEYQAGQQIAEADFDEFDADLTWAGIRYQLDAELDKFGELSLLLDAAYMTGKQTRNALLDENFDTDEDIDGEDAPETDDAGDDGKETVDGLTRETLSGWATNLVIGWTPEIAPDSTFSLGYAIGSGTGQRQREGSGTFRQTGLHSNEKNTNYYGNLTEPELANLQIITVLVTHSFGNEKAFFLQYNRYQRVSRFDETLEFEPDLDITNTDRNIGSEVSLGIQHQFNNSLQTEASISRFSPGSALGPMQQTIDYYELSIKYHY